MRPLPAIQLLTATLILGSTRWTIVRMNWVRTCSWARQILRLLPRGLAIGVPVACRRKWLSVRAIHGRGLSNTPPDGVRRDKGLRLGRDGREDAVLVESHAIRATAVLCRLEARAPYLQRVSGGTLGIKQRRNYLATSAVSARNGSALARRGRLVMLLDILLWWLLLVIWIWWRRAPRPFVGAGEPVLWRLLVLRMLASHVGARLLRRRWWEGRAHLMSGGG
jgi:hypothetical protein